MLRESGLNERLHNAHLQLAHALLLRRATRGCLGDPPCARVSSRLPNELSCTPAFLLLCRRVSRCLGALRYFKFLQRQRTQRPALCMQ